MRKLDIAKNKQQIIFHGLAFILPIIILATAFILNNIYPFGERQVLVTDYWHQYYPFLSEHWHRLREGNSLLWSWGAGGGHDYLAHFAYYMASPLNFLIVLFPHRHLREVLVVFTLIKTGLAGLFMSFFLTRVVKNHDIFLTIFSIFYALCAFILGYYWNIMWHDTISLMPLVLLGVHSLVKEGKYRLYIGSLAVAVFANFYIGLFICIIVAITFFIRLIVEKLNKQQVIRSFLLMGVSTLIGIGMSAMILLAAYGALSNSYRSETVFPEFTLYNHFTSVIGNFIPFTPPTSLDGLPNLYSGLLSILLLPVFILSKKIPLREKIIYSALLVFLVLSVNINILNFIWNGFTVTNMLPFRFSFIISFVLIAMAYRAYQTIKDEVTLFDVFEMGIGALFFHSFALIGGQDIHYILYSVMLALIYLSLFSFLTHVKNKNVFKYMLFVVVLGELFYTTYLGVVQVGTTTRNNFPMDYYFVQDLLEEREFAEVDFFRTEFARPRTLNSASAFGFDGISLFSSFANVSATEFMEGIGLLGWPRGNRYTFSASTPLTNSFLNLRYMITRSDQPIDNPDFWDLIAIEGNNYLYRNRFYLPFGFAVDPNIMHYEGNPLNPLMAQNELFNLATGLEGDLFTFMWSHQPHFSLFDMDVSSIGHYRFTLMDSVNFDNSRLHFNYAIQAPGSVYGYFRFHDIDNLNVLVDDVFRQSVEVRRPYIFSMGTFKEGQVISVDAIANSTSGNGTFYVARLDQALFEAGFAVLSENVLELTSFADTSFSGTITVDEPRILYLSLAHGDNWRAFVNGEESEILSIGGAMAGLNLSAGTHVIEFRYHNSLVNLGIKVSAISTVIYAAVLFFSRKGKNIFEPLFDKILPLPPVVEDEVVDFEDLEIDGLSEDEIAEKFEDMDDVSDELLLIDGADDDDLLEDDLSAADDDANKTEPETADEFEKTENA